MLLGPVPAVIHPQEFLTEEEARTVSEDAMLLLSAVKQGTIYSIMSFNGINKVGVVGVQLSPSDAAIGIITVFDENARGLIWETYPVIRTLITKEMQNVKSQPARVALRLFEELTKLCKRFSEWNDLRALQGKMEASINRTIDAANSLLSSGELEKLEGGTGGIKERITRLIAVLEESKSILKEKLS